MISWNADSWFLCLTLTANNQTLTATKDFKTKWPESNSASDTDKTWSASDTDIHWQNLKWHWRLNLQWSIAKGWDHDTVCRSTTASAQNVFEHRGPWQIWMIKSNSIKHNIWFWGSSLAERLTDMIEEVNRSIVVDLHRAWRWQTKNGMRIAEPKPDTDFAHCKQHLTQFTDTHTCICLIHPCLSMSMTAWLKNSAVRPWFKLVTDWTSWRTHITISIAHLILETSASVNDNGMKTVNDKKVCQASQWQCEDNRKLRLKPLAVLQVLTWWWIRRNKKKLSQATPIKTFMLWCKPITCVAVARSLLLTN